MDELEEVYTHNSINGKKVIDYIITNIPIVNGNVDQDTNISDHFPLSAELELKTLDSTQAYQKYKKSDQQEILRKSNELTRQADMVIKDSQWTKKTYQIIIEHLCDKRAKPNIFISWMK